MAAGLPSVVPNHCGNGEAVEHGVSGYLYPPQDRPLALEALRGLLLDPDRRQEMGAAAKRRAAAEFSLEQMDISFREVVIPAVRL
jgi:glycosyltransferase involved in cell wall biosynthesis